MLWGWPSRGRACSALRTVADCALIAACDHERQTEARSADPRTGSRRSRHRVVLGIVSFSSSTLLGVVLVVAAIVVLLISVSRTSREHP